MELLTTIILCGALAVSVSTASAQQPKCASHAEMSTWLLEKYEEHPVARGLSNEGNLTEVFASAGGTWTVLITLPNGPTCMTAAGESWSMDAMPLPGENT